MCGEYMVMMDLPRRNYKCTILAITFFFIFFIALNLLQHPLSTGGKFKTSSAAANAINGQQQEQQELRKKLVLGSKPPSCVNKCMNCRPCQATLVIPPHTSSSSTKPTSWVNYVISSSSSSSSHRSSQDDTYYLLSWKCRCGNKLYHP